MSGRSSVGAFLASNTGKRLLNIVYSWGASIVILGALCKILHLEYANGMLILGMVTEALVFFVSGFDDSQAGIEYTDEYDDYEDEFEEEDAQYRPRGNGNGIVANRGSGGYAPAAAYASLPLSPDYEEKMATAAESMDGFAKIMNSLNEVSLSLLASYKQISDSSQGVSESSEGFSSNIKSLNNNVVGLNEVYETQLQSVKDQMNAVKTMNDSLERIKHMYDGAISDSSAFKDETEKMTNQIKALNEVYARLLSAMNAGPATPPVI